MILVIYSGMNRVWGRVDNLLKVLPFNGFRYTVKVSNYSCPIRLSTLFPAKPAESYLAQQNI